MEDIVISIRSEFAEKIYSKEKKYELRKRVPNIALGARCWIYEPKPIGKITGFFEFDGCVCIDKIWLWDKYGSQFGIDYERYCEYYSGQEMACAWKVSNPTRIAPLLLSEFGISHAPQSYQKVVKECRNFTA